MASKVLEYFRSKLKVLMMILNALVYSTSPRAKPLTVGIGAICEDGKSAVVAADKMVTFGAPMSLQTEPPTLKKIIHLTERTLLVFSGSTSDGEEIITGTMPAIAVAPKQPISHIAEAVRASYAKHKQRRIEENILIPLLGADFKQFQALIAQSAASQLLQQVLGLVSQHNLQTDLLVAGIDDSGAHIFTITHPGQLLPLATTGFGAIGSGAVHAGVRLSLGQHTQAASLVDTIYNVYEAKRASEVAPGVGKLTDLAVIRDGKIFFADADFFKALEKAHKEKPALSPAEQAHIKEACDECSQKLSPN
jgi:20S proteasome alpha/beta subunit